MAPLQEDLRNSAPIPVFDPTLCGLMPTKNAWNRTRRVAQLEQRRVS